MSHRLSRWAGLVLLSIVLVAPVRADLAEYLSKPEPAYAWKLVKKIDHPAGTIYDMELTSQVWQKITWTHQLQVYQPKGVKPAATMLLYNTGGKSKEGHVQMGMDLAQKIKAPVAFLFDIPNQPLFGGKKEDALIAETFVQYLETKDGSWPLLFPMVKSVIKSMDAIQAMTKQEWGEPVKNFVITGGSKRGWTSWLTAASGDKRVKAIMPIVIDTLNMVEQMDHAKKSFGAYSEQIHDYTERKLVPIPPGDDAKRLWNWVDPYSYREKLTLPKFLINGNNDPYWTADALNLYWDGLKGDKWVCYVPNAGHDLNQGTKEKPNLTIARNAMAAFARSQVTDTPLPKLTWKHDDNNGKLRLTIDAKPAPTSANLWVAAAPTRDFRKARWEPTKLKVENGKIVAEIDPPSKGCLVFYGQCDYDIDGIKYPLATQVRIAESKP